MLAYSILDTRYSILDARCSIRPPSPDLRPPLGAHSRRAAVAEGLVARAARGGQLVRVSVPDDRVSRAAAEARRNSGGGGAAAAPTLGVTGLNRAPRNRSAAEIPRSRRVWASGCVSPTGARRDRSCDRPDRVDGGKRGQRSGIGAIQYRVGGAALFECSPPARRRRARALIERPWPWSKTAAGGRARTQGR